MRPTERFIRIKLDLPAVSPLPGFENHSRLLTSAHRFPAHVALLPIDQQTKVEPSLLDHFSGIAADADGWCVELAVPLEELLPTVGGFSECVLNVPDDGGSARELCLSNRMSRFHFDDNGEAAYALMPRTAPYHGTMRVSAPGTSLRFSRP